MWKFKQHNDTPSTANQRTKLEWYDPGKNIVGKYFQTTSIHGLQYLGKPKLHLCERFIWVLSVIASMAFGFFLISKIIYRYQNMPIATVLNVSPFSLEEIPFPSVTICNLNNIKRSFVNQYTNILWDAYYHKNISSSDDLLLPVKAAINDIQRICVAPKTFATRFREWDEKVFLEETLGRFYAYHTYHKSSGEKLEKKDFRNFSNPTEILINGSQSCDEMLLLCMWLDQVKNCSEIFTQITTDYGICCTFNMIPEAVLEKWKDIDEEGESFDVARDWENLNISMDSLIFTNDSKNRQYPARQQYSGRTSGLSVLLNADLNENFCSNTDAEGFAVGLNSALDMPRMKDNSVSIGAMSEVLIGVKPDITIGDESIKQYPSERRHCYFKDEFTLAYYSKYTHLNCIDECIANLTEKACDCVIQYMPTFTETCLGEKDNLVCSLKDLKCTQRVAANIIRDGISTECKICLPTCNDIRYESETTIVEMRNKSTRVLLNRFPEFDKINPFHVSLVHVFFKHDSAYPKLRKEDFGMIDLLSNGGGLLGLCMGLSALSVLEILYHCTIRPLFRCYRRKVHGGKSGNGIQPELATPTYLTVASERTQHGDLTAMLMKRQASLDLYGPHLRFGDNNNLFTIIRTTNTVMERESCKSMLEADFHTPYLKNFQTK